MDEDKNINIEEWTASTTDALDLALVNSSKNDETISFEPAFTHLIFGMAEAIYGYKGLSMSLKFDSYTMLPLFSIKWAERKSGVTEDAKSIMLEHLPEGIDQDEAEWNKKRLKELETFEIPGKKLASFYDAEGTEFSIYKSDLSDPKCKELHSRIRVLVFLFVDGGANIDDTDETWEVYFLFQTSPKSGNKSSSDNAFQPCFAGYSTVYKYFSYKDAKQHDANDSKPYTPYTSTRISQFIILPIFQGKRVGQGFYNFLFNQCVADPFATELTVEDPSAAFDDMRDRVDLRRLAVNGTAQDIIDAFVQTKITENVIAESLPETKQDGQQLTLQWIAKKCQENKMEASQFDHCVDMILFYYLGQQKKLSKGKGKGTPKEINLSEKHKFYRLFVKRRVYLKHKDSLLDYSEEEQKSMLQDTFTNLERCFKKIVDTVDFNRPVEKRKAEDENENENDQNGNKKNKV